ncbi:FlhC family transcriptional regulator [Methylomonas sp. AM2-LC]|uniref:FlhC family transcriptional regulator n=1 Tax=Methylomonas sp. AM2-LC TaxID=3153301 RepID=UPI0032678478
MIDITTFEKHALAFELLKRHALIAIIHEVTGIPMKVLRPTYKKMHGRSSKGGRPKESTKGLTRTIKGYQEATLFAVYFKSANSKTDEELIYKVIMAFDIFTSHSQDSQLDFSGAWVIAKEVQKRIVSLIKCPCGAAVLINATEELNDRCLVCKLPHLGSPV